MNIKSVVLGMGMVALVASFATAAHPDSKTRTHDHREHKFHTKSMTKKVSLEDCVPAALGDEAPKNVGEDAPCTRPDKKEKLHDHTKTKNN